MPTTDERAWLAALADRVRAFAASRDTEAPALRMTLTTGQNFLVSAIEPEPGDGFVTLSPVPEDGPSEMIESTPGVFVTPTALIVRIADIRLIELLAERPERAHVGFQVPGTEALEG